MYVCICVYVCVHTYMCMCQCICVYSTKSVIMTIMYILDIITPARDSTCLSQLPHQMHVYIINPCNQFILIPYALALTILNPPSWWKSDSDKALNSTSLKVFTFIRGKDGTTDGVEGFAEGFVEPGDLPLTADLGELGILRHGSNKGHSLSVRRYSPDCYPDQN